VTLVKQTGSRHKLLCATLNRDGCSAGLDLDARCPAGDGVQRFLNGGKVSAVTGANHEHLAAGARLQLVGGSRCDHAAVVDYHDPSCEPVGLVKVLGCQQHVGAGSDEAADRIPELDAAARVEPACRLGVDGSECRWGRVLAYEPPTRVLLSWLISPQWQIEEDSDKASEWEVRFTSETPERTLVELEHRNLDRHGEGWEGAREGVAEGWPLYLQRYADVVNA
jgi:uncharacterized protein YndB with AHSA1/START domain